MSKNKEQIIESIRTWRDYLSNVENIPTVPNHQYKDANDIYERLHTYVKYYVEDMFGVYRDEQGLMRNRPDNDLEGDAADWRKETKGKLNPLMSTWFEVAMKGKKNAVLPDPVPVYNAKQGKSELKLDDIRFEVQGAFFPVYRALRDKYDSRPWWQWFTKHREYVAERDALKVMTTLIKTMTGYTQKELDIQYQNDRVSISPELVNKDLAPQVEQEPELLAETQKQKEIVPQEPKVDPEEEVINEPTADKLKKFLTKEGVTKMKARFANEILNTEKTDVAVMNSAEKHLYDPMIKLAEEACNSFDALAMGKAIKDVKTDLVNVLENTAQKMFETAFNGLGATIVRTLKVKENGVEVDKKETYSVFGLKSLRDRIVYAQHIADDMLKLRTPAGFKKAVFGNLAKGHYVYDKTEQVRAFIKQTCGNQYTDKEIDKAVALAKNEMGVIYHEEKPDMSHVYNIDYRPNADYNRLAREKLALGMAMKLVSENKNKQRVIQDPALERVIGENYRRCQVMENSLTGRKIINWDTTIPQWSKNEEEIRKQFPDYDPEQSQKVVEDKIAEIKATKKAKPEQIHVNLNEVKGQIVPPIESAPLEINPPQKEK